MGFVTGLSSYHKYEPPPPDPGFDTFSDEPTGSTFRGLPPESADAGDQPGSTSRGLPPESANDGDPPRSSQRWFAWHAPFLNLPGTRAQIVKSLLADRQHDYSGISVADDAICPVEFAKGATGGTKSTFTVANPYMYPTQITMWW